MGIASKRTFGQPTRSTALRPYFGRPGKLCFSTKEDVQALLLIVSKAPQGGQSRASENEERMPGSVGIELMQLGLTEDFNRPTGTFTRPPGLW